MATEVQIPLALPVKSYVLFIKRLAVHLSIFS